MWHLARAIELLRNDGVLTLGKKSHDTPRRRLKKLHNKVLLSLMKGNTIKEELIMKLDGLLSVLT